MGKPSKGTPADKRLKENRPSAQTKVTKAVTPVVKPKGK
jgi:hypothetical protein